MYAEFSFNEVILTQLTEFRALSFFLLLLSHFFFFDLLGISILYILHIHLFDPTSIAETEVFPLVWDIAVLFP